MKHIKLAFIAMTLFSAVGTAAAADFTFNVPVNIQNAHPDLRQGTVQCRVFKVAGDYTAGNEIARSGGVSGAPGITLDSNGNYNGTFTVLAETNSGKNPAEGRFYECDLYFNGYSLASGARRTGVADAAYESRPGTTRTVRVTGAIPR
jgi:hypothetical protein